MIIVCDYNILLSYKLKFSFFLKFKLSLDKTFCLFVCFSQGMRCNCKDDDEISIILINPKTKKKNHIRFGYKWKTWIESFQEKIYFFPNLFHLWWCQQH